jgi:spore coat protein U-like protein
MFTKQSVSLAAAALASLVLGGTAVGATSDSNLTVNATLTSACEVSESALISFGSFSTLAAVDQTADSTNTFTVACSVDMLPTVFATGTRTLTGPGGPIAFNLSLTAGALADDLAVDGAPGTPLVISQNGEAQVVPLYARLAMANFKSMPAGAYTTSAVTVSVQY